jgi:hypothetical protein
METGRGILVLIHDICELKMTEEKAPDSEGRFRVLFDSAPERYPLTTVPFRRMQTTAAVVVGPSLTGKPPASPAFGIFALYRRTVNLIKRSRA